MAAADDAAQKAIKDCTFEAYLTLLILLEATAGEYSYVTKQLTMQFMMGPDQYPTTMTVAVDIIVNHKSTNNEGEQQGKEPVEENKDN